AASRWLSLPLVPLRLFESRQPRLDVFDFDCLSSPIDYYLGSSHGQRPGRGLVARRLHIVQANPFWPVHANKVKNGLRFLMGKQFLRLYLAFLPKVRALSAFAQATDLKQGAESSAGAWKMSPQRA